MLRSLYFLYTFVFFILSISYFATFVNPMLDNGGLNQLESLTQMSWMAYLFMFQIIFLAIGFLIALLHFAKHVLILFVKLFVVVGIVGLFISGLTLVDKTSNLNEQFQTLFWMFFVWFILLGFTFGSKMI